MLLRIFLFAFLFWAHTASAQSITVEITNLNQGIFFTPLLVSAHDADTHLFQTGVAASTDLQAMAEGGNLDGLVSSLDLAGSVSEVNPALGLLTPGASITTPVIDTGIYSYLTIVAMLLPTNDGFVGLDGWQIPQLPGTYTIMLNAYDAGTEVNDEIINGGGAPGVAGIPADPGGKGGTGGTGAATSEDNNLIHIHRGNLGDTDLASGLSDVDSRVHRWLNPVARVQVTVN